MTTHPRRIALLSLLVAPSLVWAQPRPNNTNNAPNRPQHPAVLKAYVGTEQKRLETELAELIQRRSATREIDRPYLDMQIDLRILSRWLTQQIVVADAFSDAQCVAWLRHRDLQTLAATVDAWVPQQAGKDVSKTQSDAMRTINKATFNLPAAESAGAIDSVLVPLRGPLLIALGDATGKAVDMRPANPAAAATQPAKNATTAALLTPDQIGARVTQISLSAPLRGQILAAVAAAKQAQGEESEAMTDMLRRAFDIAQSLQTDIAVDATARAEMEQQLGQAVSLFSDTRLRDVAQKYFNDLNQYRDLSTKMTALALPREVMQSLAPVFAHARSKPQDAAKLLGAIDRFAALEQEMAAIKPGAATVLGARQLDAQLKAYAAARSTFLAEAENVGGGGGAFASDISAVPTRADDLERVASLVHVLVRLPQTQERLVQLKPRPTGGLEKRITQTLVKLADADATQRVNAQTLLLQIDEIAGAWNDAQQATADPIETEAFKALVGRAWPEVEVTLKATAADLTTAIASGGAPDLAKLNLLRQSKALLADARKAVDLRAALVAATALPRWADCNLTQPKIDAIMETYRADFGPVLAAALEGSGDEKALKQQQQRYRGLLVTLQRIADRAAGCEALSADARGLIGRITTPSDKAPHQAVRFLSFASDVIDFARTAPEVDQAEVTQITDQMLSTLNRLSR